jgi:hypothetical protein
MVSLRSGVALALVVVASIALAGTASAQGPQVRTPVEAPRVPHRPSSQPASAPGSDIGFIGVPEHTSSETGIPFFYQHDAQLADQATRDMRDAAAKCDRSAYDRALNSLYARASLYDNERPATTGPEVELTLAKSRRDAAALNDVAQKRPPFPASCGSSDLVARSYAAFEAYLIGGGMVPLNGTGAVTGVDSFFGAGNFLIDNRTNDVFSTATPLAGGRLRLYWLDLKSNKFVANAQVFFESGIQTGFGAQSFIQTFSGVSATPQGFGSNTVKENFQVPILLGAGVPLTSGNQTPVFLDGYGGVTLSNSTQTLQGAESGAPGARGFFAQQNRTTVDPTVGIGLRAIFNNLSAGGAALPPLIVGANAELSFRPGSVVQAQSSAFPSETYYGTVNSRPYAAFMIRVGIPFGGVP